MPSLQLEELIEYNDFLWIPDFIYNILGFHLLRSPTKRWQRLLSHCATAHILFCHLYCKLFKFLHLGRMILQGDLGGFIRILLYIAYSTESNIKFLAIVLNRAALLKIYRALMSLYPQTAAERRIYCVNEYRVKTVRPATVLYFTFAAAIAMSPLLQSTYEYMQSDDGVEFAYLKPVPMPYNFDHRSPWAYFFVYVVEVTNIAFNTTSSIGCDCFLIGLTAQMCMHFDYISRMLNQHKPREANTAEDCAFLVDLIEKHQRILGFQKDINAIFGMSLIFSLVTVTGTLCTLAVQSILQGYSVDSLNSIAFFCTVMAQFYFVCYYGEKLINVSANLSEAAVIHRWYNGSTGYKKLLLMIMTRAQRPAELSAMGLQPISLDTLKIFVIGPAMPITFADPIAWRSMVCSFNLHGGHYTVPSTPLYPWDKYETIFPRSMKHLDEERLMERLTEPREDESRWFVYTALESYMGRGDVDGRECLLRSICENAQVSQHVGVFAEVLNVVLTPGEESLDPAYRAAYEAGKSEADCLRLYHKCPMGANILDRYLDEL